MKTMIAVCILFAGTLFAQQQTNFLAWPVLYKMSQDLVVKRGLAEDGTRNGRIYFRIGWGSCLAVATREWRTMIQASPDDGYMNLRAYAETQVEVLEDSAEHLLNCPQQPQEVKGFWRGSRPTYLFKQDEVSGRWVKGKKSPYRIRTEPVQDCSTYNVRKASGVVSNYWQLPLTAEVFRGQETFLIQDLLLDPAYGLMTVCTGKDIPITSYTF